MILRYSWRMFSGRKNSTTRVLIRRRKLNVVAVVVAGAVVELVVGVAIVAGAGGEVAVWVDVATALFAVSEIMLFEKSVRSASQCEVRDVKVRKARTALFG